MPKEVKFIISPDGHKIEADAEGFVGGECMDFAKQTIDALGQVKESKKKDVYYGHQDGHVPVGSGK